MLTREHGVRSPSIGNSHPTAGGRAANSESSQTFRCCLALIIQQEESLRLHLTGTDRALPVGTRSEGNTALSRPYPVIPHLLRVFPARPTPGTRSGAKRSSRGTRGPRNASGLQPHSPQPGHPPPRHVPGSTSPPPPRPAAAAALPGEAGRGAWPAPARAPEAPPARSAQGLGGPRRPRAPFWPDRAGSTAPPAQQPPPRRARPRLGPAQTGRGGGGGGSDPLTAPSSSGGAARAPPCATRPLGGLLPNPCPACRGCGQSAARMLTIDQSASADFLIGNSAEQWDAVMERQLRQWERTDNMTDGSGDPMGGRIPDWHLGWSMRVRAARHRPLID